MMEFAGIPIEFFLFALTLICVALFHNHTFSVAITGLTFISIYKIGFTGFKTGNGVMMPLICGSGNCKKCDTQKPTLLIETFVPLPSNV